MVCSSGSERFVGARARALLWTILIIQKPGILRSRYWLNPDRDSIKIFLSHRASRARSHLVLLFSASLRLEIGVLYDANFVSASTFSAKKKRNADKSRFLCCFVIQFQISWHDICHLSSPPLHIKGTGAAVHLILQPLVLTCRYHGTSYEYCCRLY